MDHIVVIGDHGSVSSQARTYAKYRVLAAVARHMPRVRRVRVVVSPIDTKAICKQVRCTVTVDLQPSGSLRIPAAGPHVFAAINRAVEDLRAALEQQLEATA